MAEGTTKTIVQLVLVNDTGDSYYRMRWPLQDLAKLRPNWRVINLDAKASERFLWAERADLLVLFQSADIDILPIIKARKARHLKTLIEYNDNFYAPARWSPVAKPWSSPLLWQTYELIMKSGDGLLVTGQGLVDLFREQISAPIHVLSNHFPREIGEFTRSWHYPTNEFAIGWAGSLGHMADILALMPVFQRLVRDFPSVVIHLMGNGTLPQLSGIGANRLRFTSWGSMDDYFRFWGPVHIGVAPLLDTPYNRCRSDIKAVEMSACGVLPLVQDSLPYADFVRDTGVKVFRNYEELEAAIRFYIGHPMKLREDTERCFQYVAERRIGPHHQERLELYERMMEGSDPLPFSWPVPCGYHELDGSPEKQTESFTLLAEVQNLWNRKLRTEALHLIEEAVRTNPDNPDWALAELKCLASFQPSVVHGRTQELERRFPRDLRFLLVSVGAEENDQARQKRWAQFVERLKTLRSPSIEFFQPDILKTLSREVKKPEVLIAASEKLLEVYPEVPDLHLMMGEAYQRLGQDEAALEHFSWLARTQDTFERIKDFLLTLEGGYAHAWCAALHSRLQNRKRED